MSTQVFKISLYYDNKWEIKLCISIDIYCKLSKTWYDFFSKLPYGMSYVSHVLGKISQLCYDRLLKMGNKVMYLS